MDNLARAIVALIDLFKELGTLWMNGHGNIAANVAGPGQSYIGDSILAIFANGVSFFAELSVQILHQMGNVTS